MATPTPNPNPSPKARFQSVQGNIAAHKLLLEHAHLERSLDFAMLEYQAQLATRITDPNSAMAAGSKLQGALEFLQTFKLLAETGPVLLARKDVDNLPDVAQLRKQ